jgi:hypothetical protein
MLDASVSDRTSLSEMSLTETRCIIMGAGSLDRPGLFDSGGRYIARMRPFCAAARANLVSRGRRCAAGDRRCSS